MTLQSITMTGAALPGAASDAPPRPVRVTKSLLGYGVIAGPFYLVVSLAQALTRDGFELTRHAWSLLANGELGWIQIINFTLTGAMLVAFAVGLRRALAGGRGGRWAPRLIGAFGVRPGLPAGRATAAPAHLARRAALPGRRRRLPLPGRGLLCARQPVCRRGAAGLGGVLPGGRGGVPGRLRRAVGLGGRLLERGELHRRARGRLRLDLGGGGALVPPSWRGYERLTRIADLTALIRMTEATDTETRKGSSRCATWSC
jgi:hypothetical protein